MQTSRERFLEERQRMKDAHEAANPQPEVDPDLAVSDEEVDEVEADMQEVDKNLGSETHSVASTKLSDVPARNIAPQVQKTGLSTEQRATLNKLVSIRENIPDPVLRHLVLQKHVQEKGYQELKKQVKDINDRITRELMQASNNLLKSQAIIENLDRQILEYLDDDPPSV